MEPLRNKTVQFYNMENNNIYRFEPFITVVADKL